MLLLIKFKSINILFDVVEAYTERERMLQDVTMLQEIMCKRRKKNENKFAKQKQNTNNMNILNITSQIKA